MFHSRTGHAMSHAHISHDTAVRYVTGRLRPGHAASVEDLWKFCYECYRRIEDARSLNHGGSMRNPIYAVGMRTDRKIVAVGPFNDTDAANLYGKQHFKADPEFCLVALTRAGNKDSAIANAARAWEGR